MQRTFLTLCVPPSLTAIPSNYVLYRKLIKLYLKKFDTDHTTIIKAWKLTKGEFYKNRLLKDPSQIIKAKKEALAAITTVRGGIIPIYQHRDNPSKTYYKVSKDVLDESDGHVDPVTGEEFLRKFKDYLPKADAVEAEKRLREVGRWKGEELPQTITSTIKTKVTSPKAKDI